MSAYATTRRQLGALNEQSNLAVTSVPAIDRSLRAPAPFDPPGELGGSVINHIIDQLADRIATAIADRLASSPDATGVGEWLDSRRAAEYLDVHRDTLRKLAAERAIPSEQEGPGCKLYFRRSDLDSWRRSGGRPRHITEMLHHAA